MAFVDAQTFLSDAQALTASAASTNLYDLGSDRNPGVGEPLALVVIGEVAMAGTSPTLVVGIQTDDNASFSSATTIIASQSVSALAAGGRIIVPLPADSSLERYIRAYYTVGGTTPTVTVSAYLQPLSMIENQAYYADAITIT